MPISRMACATRSGVCDTSTPNCSRMSALPHCVENERLPCLATRAPAPATTNAAMVEMLNVEPRAAARSAGIEQRLGVHARVDSNGLFAHGSREAQQFGGGLALHSQAHQERGYLRRSGRAVQNGEHGVVGFGGRQIFARGNFVKKRQKHGGLWFHVTMSTRTDFMRLAAVVIAFTISAIYAQEHPRPPAAAHEAGAPPAAAPTAPPVEKTSKTKHSIQINGKTLDYTATAGTLVLKKDDKPWASMFYVAYTLDGVQEGAKRPITFAFNGGPGSSSVWLHMGALGPKRVAMGPNGEQPKPPYHLVDNEDTALQFTDLVFIDPVTTGFSRAAPGEKESQFHGFDGDLDSVAEFIRLYLTRSERWAIAEVSGGRKLRHHASGGAFATFAGERRHLSERHHVDFHSAQL